MGIVGFTPWKPVMGARGFAARLQRALENIARMDEPVDPAPVTTEGGVLHLPTGSLRSHFQAWLDQQDESTRRVAAKAPLNRVYRLRVPAHLQDGLGRRTLIVFPVGYAHVRGAPVVVCWALNAPPGAVVGSQAHPFRLPPDALEDVTDDARDRTLDELYA